MAKFVAVVWLKTFQSRSVVIYQQAWGKKKKRQKLTLISLHLRALSVASYHIPS